MKDLQFIYGLCKLSRPLEPASGRGVGSRGEKRRGWRPAPRLAPRPTPRYVNQEPGRHKTFTSQTIARLIAAASVATPPGYYSSHLHAAFEMLSGWCHEATNV